MTEDKLTMIKNKENSFLFNFSRKSTPLLLSSTSGALDAVQCLVSLGANVAYKDASGHTVIHLAASNLHTNIIEYFIHLNNPLVPTWRILVGLYNLFIIENQIFDYLKI